MCAFKLFLSWRDGQTWKQTKEDHGDHDGVGGVVAPMRTPSSNQPFSLLGARYSVSITPLAFSESWRHKDGAQMN